MECLGLPAVTSAQGGKHLFPDLLDTKGFPKRWECGPAWDEEPFWGWLTIGSDLVTWAAYLTIPLVLLLFIYNRRRDIPFPRIFWLFGAFIFACGTVHLIEAIIFWHPVYKLSAVVKFLTAAVSSVTVVALVRITPLALTLRSPMQLDQEVKTRTQQLETLNRRLLAEVAERERGAEELRDYTERLRLALQGGQMGTWDWNLETNIVQLDTNEAELLGIGGEKGIIQITEFFERVHPDERDGLNKILDHSITTGAPYFGEFRLRMPDGNWRWLAGHGRVMTAGSAGRRMMGVNYDITARKELEREIVEARQTAESASQAKSEFLANVSHEIRTPLTAILGCAEVLHDDIKDESNRELTRLIKNQGELLLGILNDVLDLSKIEAGKIEIQEKPCSLAPIIADVRSLLEPQAEEKGISLSAKVATKMPPQIVSDPLRLRQVLLNLVGNAIKFTDEGHVTIECRYDDGWQVFAVHDTGIGIPQEDQTRIFDAFEQIEAGETRTAQGTGLGLAICQKLIKMLGGKLTVESTVGEGSTFEVRLPAPDAENLEWISLDAIPLDPRKSGVFPQQLNCRVLVADDTRSIQFLITRMLHDRVNQLTVVEDGNAALDEIRRASAAGQPYDVILMDMQMPHLDGYTATKNLRSEGIETPVIALTASAMPGDMEKCLKAGCNGYLPKPLDRAQLIEEITKWLS